MLYRRRVFLAEFADMGYLFEPEKLQEIVKPAVGQPFDQMVDTVISGLAAAYPGYVETKKNFFFSLAGGITGMINVIHGSFTEYIILFGTPIGSEGYSGRYSIDIYDIVLSGEMYTYIEPHPGRRVEHPLGEIAYLPKGTAKAVSLARDTWMLEYGRGPVPTCLLMGLSDAITAYDYHIIGKTVYTYGRQVLGNLFKGKF